uniref:Uncharacterized protein n=1 Tax=Arundo donax TaxID=35708 RepID=A0A0A8ZF52_ARUDO
MATAVAVGF